MTRPGATRQPPAAFPVTSPAVHAGERRPSAAGANVYGVDRETETRTAPGHAAGDRERVGGLLARADRDLVVDLADACLVDEQMRVVRAPEVGTVLTRVREPIAGLRFNLVDLLVTSAEVELAGEPGWGMRVGEDRAAALAQAVCDAEIARGGPRADRIRAAADQVEAALRDARAAEWERLQPTIVRFEEVL